MTPARWLALALFSAALTSVWFGALAIFVAFACFLFWVTLSVPKGRERRVLLLLCWLSLALCCVGLARFVANQAFFGMSEAARLGTSKAVVSRLREIRFAEARARELTLIDPDGNRRGSALFLGELSGASLLRGTQKRTTPLLDGKFRRSVSTPRGPATQLNGYLFMVCLPGASGPPTANPSRAVDERAAEEHFLAYAWPETKHQGHGQLFTIDANGKLLVYDNRGADGELSFVGPSRAPSCRLSETQERRFKPWRGKDSTPR